MEGVWADLEGLIRAEDVDWTGPEGPPPTR